MSVLFYLLLATWRGPTLTIARSLPPPPPPPSKNDAISEFSLSLVDGRLAFRSIEDLNRYAAAIAGRDTDFLDWLDESIGFVSLRSKAKRDADPPNPMAEQAVTKWGLAVTAAFNSAFEIQVAGQVLRLPEAEGASMDGALAGIVESIAHHENSRALLSNRSGGISAKGPSQEFTYTDSCTRAPMDVTTRGQVFVKNASDHSAFVRSTQVEGLPSGSTRVRSVYMSSQWDFGLVDDEGVEGESWAGSDTYSVTDGGTTAIDVGILDHYDGRQYVYGSYSGYHGSDVYIYEDRREDIVLGDVSIDESCLVQLDVPRP